ncbi:hemerythrin-like domain-containing protein [Micromonospora pisi]|uniref:Hemerythrin-like domain-containing protein n=1 Tax=Micromonospora pisi TaxID=589240 RepID=A0A495JKQ5_9ACTN|nr:hemerythrin domain-containing protein [Micromonospora pisi]RKR89640.1 hemerythrin-like domain-containing protein [Micromonospora pisi]
MPSAATPMADSRDMYMVHTVFRREFGAAPQVIRNVADGDVKRARLVADHVELLTFLLNTHHKGEDDLVWPKLLERGATEIAPMVETMERQHEAIHGPLDEVDAKLGQWRRTADAIERDALAAAVERLIPPLLEHLATEEANLLSLIDKHLTAAEWAEVAAASMGKLPKGKLPLSFGMALYEAEPEHVQVLKEAVPTPVWFVFSRLGPRAYANHSRRIHGTATPARFAG